MVAPPAATTPFRKRRRCRPVSSDLAMSFLPLFSTSRARRSLFVRETSASKTLRRGHHSQAICRAALQSGGNNRAETETGLLGCREAAVERVRRYDRLSTGDQAVAGGGRGRSGSRCRRRICGGRGLGRRGLGGGLFGFLRNLAFGLGDLRLGGRHRLRRCGRGGLS